jgi:hypothetical protein
MKLKITLIILAFLIASVVGKLRKSKAHKGDDTAYGYATNDLVANVAGLKKAIYMDRIPRYLNHLGGSADEVVEASVVSLDHINI